MPSITTQIIAQASPNLTSPSQLARNNAQTSQQPQNAAQAMQLSQSASAQAASKLKTDAERNIQRPKKTEASFSEQQQKGIDKEEQGQSEESDLEASQVTKDDAGHVRVIA